MVELVISRVVAGGAGLARDGGGQVVFVEGALPGELVSAELTEQRRDFARARLVDVLEPSPGRVEPPCRFVSAGCGGCGWQHVATDLQRDLKRQIVTEALTRLGRVSEPEVVDAAPLPTIAYRTTVRVAVREGRACFHVARGGGLVSVDHCLVAHPLVNEVLLHARFDGATEAVVRAGVASGERLAWVSPATSAVTLPTAVAVGEHTAVHEMVAGEWFRIGARSFFQSRPDGAEALVREVRRLAGPLADGEGPLVDAYAGVGLFAKTLGRRRPVTAIELDRHCAADARHNLAGMPVRVVRSEVARWRAQPAELVVADPARTGLGRTAARVLATTGAAQFILVSCDAGALGRDAGLLESLGYRHSSSVLVDIFPHTPHVEVVSSFVRR